MAQEQPVHQPRVVLGVCGGIAAYKAVEVCRQLVDAGVHVTPVLTAEATRFIGALTFSALASEPAQTSLWDEDTPIPHTRLGQSADLILVVPSTAHLMARYAAGLSDDLLTATLLATRAPVLLCPAMHTEMWEHPSVQENLATLVRRGVGIVPPESGHLAGGDSGEGRLADPAVIVARALAVLGRGGPQDLAGLSVVVSAGGTREPLDPVRFLTNRSSGKQGHALAEAAARRGAAVTLVTASALPLAADVAPAVSRVAVESAADMEAALGRSSLGADVIIMAAAVADFRPKVAAERKLSKEDGLPELVLESTPDILAGLVARRGPGQILVGFAAETNDVLERGQRKLVRKGVDFLVVNDVSAPGAGFDHDTNAVTIMGADGSRTDIALTSKNSVANAVLDSVIAHHREKRSSQ
ncbi:MAG TPA: bifunctional phosphopantothenoylcysteine decarboxylase/phosphopantothenate--cysteine ligase CoaBC [Acidimicrobiales bacterium]|jgi:phosphopantothenoylcysteine decarboxylase/phosphopantothenate--cysteine ligase|nr:bifunctional phosphopantothenoylcysteine decarboxylase/phosphopantothenate--cysteine ligase CoaBC [Acidimicrobiales bacterium]